MRGSAERTLPGSCGAPEVARFCFPHGTLARPGAARRLAHRPARTPRRRLAACEGAAFVGRLAAASIHERVERLRIEFSDAIREALARDYAAMADMFIEDPPAFKELLAGLEALEKRINQAGSGSA